MTVRERFAEEWKMPLMDVQRLVYYAVKASKCSEKHCNGDAHADAHDKEDKNECAGFWRSQQQGFDNAIMALVSRYGFTGIEYCGLGPTLKRGEQFVEVPY